MRSDAPRQRRLQSRRKGAIEVNSLVMWLILLAFLILSLVIVAYVRTDATDTVTSLCDRTFGVFGCS